MKKYLIFCGDSYYPQGGWADFAGAFDDLEEAKSAASELCFDWGHVVCTATMRVIWWRQP
jgi:hypothetical protein